MQRVLITGAGTPQAISFFRSIDHGSSEVFMGADDALSAGLYLVAEANRVLLPSPKTPLFAQSVLNLCKRLNITRIIPMADAHLHPLAAIAEDFQAAGVQLISSSVQTIETCSDTYSLYVRCHDQIPFVATQVWNGRPPVHAGPWIATKRGLSHKRKEVTLHDLETLPDDGQYVLQQVPAGAEFLVDVLLDNQGRSLASVPRERLKVCGGVEFAARTVHDRALQVLAIRAAQMVNISGLASVTFRVDAVGQPRLVAISPRCSESIDHAVEAGANLPNALMRLADGYKVQPMDFSEVAIVRTLSKHVLPGYTSSNKSHVA